MGVGRWETPSPYAHFSIQEVFPTADIKQDLLSLQYKHQLLPQRHGGSQH